MGGTGQDQRVQRMLRLAFRPSFGRIADSVVALGTYDARVVQHLRLVREQRVLLQGFRDSLARVDIVGEAAHLAAPFLPSGEVNRRPPPRLAYAFFGPEAYGGEEGIIMDLLFAKDRGSHLLAIIGHEVHHYHVGYLSGLRFPERSAAAFALLQSLRNLANEGTADRVDLRFPVGPPEMPEDVSPAYNAGYRDAAATLREMDSLMSRVGSDTARMRQAGKEVSARLVFGGHPVGAYMAERIDDRLGRAALIAAVGNPFAFFRQFNEAEGRLRGVRPFSEATLKLCADLEAGYPLRSPPEGTTQRSLTSASSCFASAVRAARLEPVEACGGSQPVRSRGQAQPPRRQRTTGALPREMLIIAASAARIAAQLLVKTTSIQRERTHEDATV